jgi:hypothetical protein
VGREPRVFGERAKFRRSLATHRTTGHDLVGQAEGARLSMEQAAENRLIAYVVEEEWTGRVEGWRGRVHRLLRQYLGPHGFTVIHGSTNGVATDGHCGNGLNSYRD